MFRYLQIGKKSRDFLEVSTAVIRMDYRCITFYKDESIVSRQTFADLCTSNLDLCLFSHTAYVGGISSPVDKTNRPKKQKDISKSSETIIFKFYFSKT